MLVTPVALLRDAVALTKRQATVPDVVVPEEDAVPVVVVEVMNGGVEVEVVVPEVDVGVCFVDAEVVVELDVQDVGVEIKEVAVVGVLLVAVEELDVLDEPVKQPPAPGAQSITSRETLWE
jgi:hypothetical protein